jgi:hypothetical protein
MCGFEIVMGVSNRFVCKTSNVRKMLPTVESNCANLVLTDGNSLLSPDEINMLVTLRMNCKFMQFMRENHAKDGQHKRLLSESRPAE